MVTAAVDDGGGIEEAWARVTTSLPKLVAGEHRAVNETRYRLPASVRPRDRSSPL